MESSILKKEIVQKVNLTGFKQALLSLEHEIISIEDSGKKFVTITFKVVNGVRVYYPPDQILKKDTIVADLVKEKIIKESPPIMEDDKFNALLSNLHIHL